MLSSSRSVKTIGCSFVPSARIFAPRVMISVPGSCEPVDSSGSPRTVTPASIVSVAPLVT